MREATRRKCLTCHRSFWGVKELQCVECRQKSVPLWSFPQNNESPWHKFWMEHAHEEKDVKKGMRMRNWYV